jgi:HEAT repeat protein
MSRSTSRTASAILLFAIPCVPSLLAPTNAWAHGGNYGGPGGGVPPGLRTPGDPIPPPPPPPPTTPPDTKPPPGTTPAPTPTGPTTPGQPPPNTPVTEPGGPGAGPRKGPTIGFDNWTFWWAYESPAILRVKEAIYRLRISGGSGLDAMTGGKGGHSDAHRLTEVSVREQVIPTLLRVMDPKRREHPDARSAAYLALARVTEDPAHIPLIEAGVFGHGGAPDESIVRESAALSLGLLRRSDAARQFDAKELDRVRDTAFRIVEDDTMPTRTRAFAALALGMLGDQPTLRGADTTTGDGPATGPSTGPAPGTPTSAALSPTTAARLFDDLSATYAEADVPACLVLALSLQPSASVTPAMAEAFKDATLKCRLRGRSVDDVTASYAALALGRVGGSEYAKTLALALEARSVPLPVKRSAAIALGEMGQRLDADERRDIVASLVRAADATKESSTKAFAVIAVARLLARDAENGRTDAWSAKGHPDRWLLDMATRQNYVLRPYGALALGLVGRAITDHPDVMDHGVFRQAAIVALREGLVDPSMDPRSRGAFAVGLGLVADSGSSRVLLGVLTDKSLDRELRSYAALALGMLGEASKESVDGIVAALREGSSEELRLQAATALGLLGRRDAVDMLLKELSDADTQVVQGQIVTALGHIGDDRAIAPLIAIVRDDARPDLTRAMAVVGLGLVGDLEPVPSFSRISASFNYRSCVNAIREFLTIL